MKQLSEGDRAKLVLIDEHLTETLQYSGRGQRKFFSDHDPDTRNGVENNLRKALETMVTLSQPFKRANPEIDWDDIHRRREQMIHGYAGVEPEDTWRFVKRKVPFLLRRVRRPNPSERDDGTLRQE